MNLPKSIIVFVINDSGIVSGLVCSVQLLTRQKNNFSLGLYRTDDNGKFVITKEIMELKIKENVDLFAMDYNNSPENLIGSIEIIIENIEDLEKRKNRIEDFFQKN